MKGKWYTTLTTLTLTDRFEKHVIRPGTNLHKSMIGGIYCGTDLMNPCDKEKYLIQNDMIKELKI